MSPRNPISRRDLIIAGANFEFTDPSGALAWASIVGDYDEVHIFNHLGLRRQIPLREHFLSTPRDGRRALASMLQSKDAEASQALAEAGEIQELAATKTVTNWNQGFFPQAILDQFELDKDAFLFAAAQHGYRAGVDHYFPMGTDPMRPTFDGDCAARAFMARGCFKLSQTHELANARHLVTRETGAFELAREGMAGMLKTALRLGVDPYAQDASGKTMLDHLDTDLRPVVEEIISELQAAQFLRQTPMVPGAVVNPTQAARRSMRL